MHEEIVAAGFGGQGIIRLGKILAYTVMLEDRYVTYFPSYGAEVRGGTANCSVIISDDTIPTPIVSSPTAMIIMNHLSYERFVPKLKDTCLILVNSSLVELETVSKNTLLLPFTEMAVEMGNSRIANMIALGALVKKKKLARIETLKQATAEMFSKLPGKLLDLNVRALEKGADSV